MTARLDFRSFRHGPLKARLGPDATAQLRKAARALYLEGRSFWGVAATLGLAANTVQRWAQQDRWPTRERVKQNVGNLRQEEQSARRHLALLGQVEAEEDRRVLALPHRCASCLGVSPGPTCAYCGMPR